MSNVTEIKINHADELFNKGEFHEALRVYNNVNLNNIDSKDASRIKKQKQIIKKLSSLPKQKLTSEQIEYVLDFIKPFKGIPDESAKFKTEQKNKLRKQLQEITVYPILIPKLKNKKLLKNIIIVLFNQEPWLE